MKVTPAFSPFSVGSVPRCSSSSDSNGAPWPMLRPKTVTEVIAATSPQRRSRAVCGAVLASVLGMIRSRGSSSTWSGTDGRFTAEGTARRSR